MTLDELDTLSIENEKKNQLIRDQEQRIRELEECLRLMTFAFKLVSPLYSGDREVINKAEQLLNQKQ